MTATDITIIETFITTSGTEYQRISRGGRQAVVIIDRRLGQVRGLPRADGSFLVSGRLGDSAYEYVADWTSPATARRRMAAIKAI